jgi:hypothetical protein
MTLEDYLRKQLSRSDPYPAIDHSIRAELHADGRVSFYIHAEGRDSDTERFWVKDNTVEEKRLYREPLPEELWPKILAVTKRFWAKRSHDPDYLVVSEEHDQETVADWIESIGGGLTAGYHHREGHPDTCGWHVFKPCLGGDEKERDLAYLKTKHGLMAYCYTKS